MKTTKIALLALVFLKIIYSYHFDIITIRDLCKKTDLLR